MKPNMPIKTLFLDKLAKVFIRTVRALKALNIPMKINIAKYAVIKYFEFSPVLINVLNIGSFKNKIHKIQMAFKNSPSVKTLTEMNVQIISQVGNYFSIMARGDIDEIMEKLNSLNPVFIETMPSTLEEVFINEMEGAGYGK